MANSTTIEYLPDGRAYLEVSAATKTLAEADSGLVQNCIITTTLTLPATANTLTWVIRNAGLPKTNGPAGTGDDESVLITITPNGSDKIMGMGLTSADGTSIANTLATAKVGDEITLVGCTDGWSIQKVVGIWA